MGGKAPLASWENLIRRCAVNSAAGISGRKEKTAQINTSLITRVKHSQPPDMWTSIKMKELKMGGDGGVWVGGETGRDRGVNVMVCYVKTERNHKTDE